MSLISKLENKSRIAAACLPLIFSGCASNFEHFGEIEPNSPAAAIRDLFSTPRGQGLIGAAVLGQQAQQQALQGNVGQARRLQAASDVVYANAQQQAAVEAARAGASQQNVYVENTEQRMTQTDAIKMGRAAALASRGDSYLVHMIPFDPNSAGIRIFRNAQRINTGQGVRVYMEGENYTFDRGETMQLVVHYPENRPGTRKYGVYCRAAGNTTEMQIVRNMESIPLMFTRNIAPVNTSNFSPGEYDFLVVGGYSVNEAEIESETRVIIR